MDSIRTSILLERSGMICSALAMRSREILRLRSRYFRVRLPSRPVPLRGWGGSWVAGYVALNRAPWARARVTPIIILLMGILSMAIVLFIGMRPAFMTPIMDRIRSK